MPYNQPLRSPGGMRNQIAQTMMNIGNPPPQVQPPGGLPPGTMMAPSPLKTLMGMDQQGPSSFMGGQAPPQGMPTAPTGIQQGVPPQPPQGMPQPPPPPPPQQQPLFDAPPAVPGQAPPMFAKPPTF